MRHTRTSVLACTWRTCSGAWRGSVPTTDPRRASCAARRPSATRASWRPPSPAAPSVSSTATARRNGEKHLPALDPPVIDQRSGVRRINGLAKRGALTFRRRPPDDRVLPLAALRRAAADGSQGAFREARGPRERTAELSIGPPAHRAARDRARPAQRGAARRGQHERPGAGHRHRRPARGDPGGLPGHDCGSAAADGPRGAASGRERRSSWWPATAPSIGTWRRIRTGCSTPPRRRRAWTRRTSTCCWHTCGRPRSSCRSGPVRRSDPDRRTTCGLPRGGGPRAPGG